MNEEMTDKQSERLGLLERFYEIQKAIDSVTDPESKKVLEKQKEKISKELTSN